MVLQMGLQIAQKREIKMQDNNSMKEVEKGRQKMMAGRDSEGCTDKLEKIFSLQEQFGRQFIDFGNLSIQEKEKWTKELLVALMNEGFEALNWTNAKHWKKPVYPINEMELKYELIDMLHFLLGLMILWGMDAKECFSIYIAKNKENHERQEKGY